MKQINLTKRTTTAFGLGLMLAMAPLAMAQEAAPPTAPGAAGATSSTANEPGSIDTSQRIAKTTTTTTTTKTDGGSANVVIGDTDTAPLPNTGGEPLLFVLAGSLLIGGGWVLRRKMVQS